MTFNDNTEFLMYQTEDGKTKIEVRMEDETVWLSLNQMAELFQRDKSVISRHIKNIFTEGELDEKSVVANFATTAADGKTYNVDYYNLDVIISVGYRVKSPSIPTFHPFGIGPISLSSNSSSLNGSKSTNQDLKIA